MGKAIGRAVSATDGDGDILLYELLDTPDLRADEGEPRFTFVSASGQIRAARNWERMQESARTRTRRLSPGTRPCLMMKMRPKSLTASTSCR